MVSMYSMVAPCKGCTKRYPCCHDFCDGYKEFKAFCEQEKKTMEHERMKYDYGFPAKPMRRR